MDWRVLAVALVAAVAGCGAAGGPEVRSETVTPAPVPAATASPAPAEVALAPGVTADGIHDVNALVRAHIGTVTNSSHAWEARLREGGGPGDRRTRLLRTRRVTYEVSRSSHRYRTAMRQVVNGDGRYVQRREAYGNDSVGFSQWLPATRDEPTYRRSTDTPAPAYYALPHAVGRYYLALTNETVTRVDVGDRPHFAISGTRGRLPEYLDVEEFEARVVVREDGLIRRVNASFVAHTYDEPVRVRYSFAFTDPDDATASPPAWLPAARERTGGDR